MQKPQTAWPKASNQQDCLHNQRTCASAPCSSSRPATWSITRQPTRATSPAPPRRCARACHAGGGARPPAARDGALRSGPPPPPSTSSAASRAAAWAQHTHAARTQRAGDVGTRAKAPCATP